MRRIACSSLSLMLAGVLAAGCAAPTDDEEAGGQSSEALSATAKSLAGEFMRTTPTAPIVSATLGRRFEARAISFQLILDAKAVPGLCPASTNPFPYCREAIVEGSLTKTTGSPTAGSFTLEPTDPNAVSPAAKAFLGKYTFTRSDAGLVLKDVATATTHTLRVTESLQGAPTEVKGTWNADSRSPPEVYQTLELTPGPGTTGTYRARRTPTGRWVSGTYEMGGPNAMIGIALWTLTEAGGKKVKLGVGAVQRDAAHAIVALGGILADQPSVTFTYHRQ
jgi:hypothetical protein